MPSILQSLLNETEENFKVSQSTFPGARLKDHLEMVITINKDGNGSARLKKKDEKTPTEKLIKSKLWDYIILQEEPTRLFVREMRTFETNQIIQKIKSLSSNKECEFVIFKTGFPKVKYPLSFCFKGNEISQNLISEKQYCSTVINSDLELERVIGDSFLELAKSNNLKICDAFSKINEYQDIELIDKYGHPSKAGAFFNAAVFYKFLTKKSAQKLKWELPNNTTESKSIKTFLDKG